MMIDGCWLMTDLIPQPPHFRASQAQFDAAQQLGDLARLSVADALTVVSTAGLLPRVARNLEGAHEGTLALGRAYGSLLVVTGSVNSGDFAVCRRAPLKTLG